MNNIEIYILGELRMIVDGEDITSKMKNSPKKTLLLEYLLINKNRPVTTGTLVDVLWNGKDDLNLENTLKTLVSRLRKDLSDCGLDKAIVTKRGAYMWNPDLDCSIDLYKFEDLCAKMAAVDELGDDDKKDFDEILFLYSDGLLSNSGLNSWIAPKTYYYQDLYLKTVYRYIDLLKNKDLHSDIIRVCKIALEIDAFDTKLNLELMNTLLKIGKSKEALAQYQNITDLNYTYMGTKPPEEILEFYKVLLMNEQNEETNIEDIYHELTTDEEEDLGAYVCEYAIFKDIYRLYMRNLKRLDTTMFLGICSIKSINRGEMNPLELDAAMRKLKDLLVDNLRNGDTVSRYSLNQFALLLPSIDNYEIGRMVMKRLQNLFYADGDNSRYNFDFRLLEMNSASDDKIVKKTS